jgi:hypothetical protein
MKYLLFFLVLTWGCNTQNHNLINQKQRSISDYEVKVKLVKKSELQDTYVYHFRGSEQSYKAISDRNCDFRFDSVYVVNLLLLRRPQSMIPNLSIEFCVYNKRDKICTDDEYNFLL